ncbi:MAG TPA: zf-TFIIB domain-containing protein [Streptosporangiaceae bacterium]|jgi:hypothetical protein
MADAILHCPKCDAGMVSFQRDGVVLEQCTDCRGVFLGEGGLTRLIESAGTPPSVVAPNGHPKPIYGVGTAATERRHSSPHRDIRH